MKKTRALICIILSCIMLVLSPFSALCSEGPVTPNGKHYDK